MATKHIVITGCDKGIGKCLAQILSKQGYRLTLGFQNLKDNEIQSSEVTARQLNLTSMSSVERFAEEIEDCHILINNAGTMVGNIRKIHGIEETMLTNHLGHFHLTNLLLPVIKSTSVREGSECRIVNVGSSLESKAMAFPGEDPTGKSALRGELPDSVQFGDMVSSADTFYGLLSGMQWMRNGPSPYFMHNAYGNASLCILLTSMEMAKKLAAENSDTLVTVNVVCPGYVNTSLWNDSTFWNLFRRIAFKSPTKAASFIASVATDQEYAGKTGQLFSAISDVKPSKMVSSVELAEKVWDESFALIEKLRSESDTTRTCNAQETFNSKK